MEASRRWLVYAAMFLFTIPFFLQRSEGSNNDHVTFNPRCLTPGSVRQLQRKLARATTAEVGRRGAPGARSTFYKSLILDIKWRYILYAYI